MTLDVLQAVYEDLGGDEADKLKVYDDATGKEVVPGYTLVGNPTIARGVNLAIGISPDESYVLTMGRIKRTTVEVRREWPWFDKCPEEVQRGFLNMAYNVGIPRLSGFHRMLACLQAGDYQGASREALDSAWAKQVGERSQRIANRFLSCAVPTGETESE